MGGENPKLHKLITMPGFLLHLQKLVLPLIVGSIAKLGLVLKLRMIHTQSCVQYTIVVLLLFLTALLMAPSTNQAVCQCHHEATLIFGINLSSGAVVK